MVCVALSPFLYVHSKLHPIRNTKSTDEPANDDYVASKDLEIKLRQCAEKLRVVPSLTGGAQVLFPTSHTTVAVRVYDTATIESSSV